MAGNIEVRRASSSLKIETALAFANN